MTKQKMRDLVVLLPGITGSVLQEADGEDIWASSGGALWNWLSSWGDSVQNLKLPAHLPGTAPPDDGVRARALMPGFHGVFGLWKIDGYRAIAKLINDKFDIYGGGDAPTNFVEFPYDWRRSNREAAAKLKSMVNKQLHAWRAWSHWQDAKVILLAHSMGGLISRYYLEVLEGWRDCRALVTFGTLYWGSVDAISYVANGYKNKFVDLTNVLRLCPSVYELMACYDVVKVGPDWKKVAEAGPLPHVDAARAADALKFHDEIAATAEMNRNDPAYHTQGYKTIPMIGVHQPTLQSVVLDSGRLVAQETRPKSIDDTLEGGDGRVPRVSAAPIEIFEDYRESFFVERHGSLQNNAQLLDDLCERLRQMQARKPVRGTFAKRSKQKACGHWFTPRRSVPERRGSADRGRVDPLPLLRRPYCHNRSTDRWTSTMRSRPHGLSAAGGASALPLIRRYASGSRGSPYTDMLRMTILFSM
ncbi:MAG: lipase/acyltransferase domain-containing protein [Gammaproteobacteria bacterium]